MKLGTETGSVINHLHARGTRGQPTPTVGMGATILMWTDRKAGTIVAVEPHGKGTILTVQVDRAKVVNGSTHDGSAEYEYSANPDGRKEYYRAAGPDERWEQVYKDSQTKRWRKLNGHGLKIGVRDEYRDPSF